MAKLTNEQIELLNGLGFEGKTDEEVRPAILKKLEEFEVFEVDEDPIEDLINILDAFMDMEGEKEEKPAKVEEKVEEATPSEDEEDETDTESESEDNDGSTEQSDTDESDSGSDEDEDESNTEPVVEKKPKKKAEKKADKKPAKKTPKAKADKKAKVARVGYKGGDADHVARMKEILEPYFEHFELEGDFKNSCISVALAKSDGKRSILCIESIAFKGEETFMKVVFNGMNQFKKTNNIEEMMEESLPEEFLERFKMTLPNAYPFVKAVTVEELPALLTDEMVNPMLEKMGAFDKKLRKNREKMEEEYENEEKGE